MYILINSSKTMAIPSPLPSDAQRQPRLLSFAETLAATVQSYSVADVARVMHLSPMLAAKTHDLMRHWGAPGASRGLALDTFRGDIYKGLRAQTLTPAARSYADHALYILSGLYGGIRPFDAIEPYRLEVGYPVRPPQHANLYSFWGSHVADLLDAERPIINLASEEYAKLVLPFVNQSRVVSPLFLTAQKMNEPSFVAIHAKLARGACARWLLEHEIRDPQQLRSFAQLGYTYDATRSTKAVPVFVRHGPLTLAMLD